MGGGVNAPEARGPRTGRGHVEPGLSLKLGVVPFFLAAGTYPRGAGKGGSRRKNPCVETHGHR